MQWNTCILYIDDVKRLSRAQEQTHRKNWLDHRVKYDDTICKLQFFSYNKYCGRTYGDDGDDAYENLKMVR